jgi:hypothetical protein
MGTSQGGNMFCHIRQPISGTIVCKSLYLNDLYTRNGWSPIETPRQTLITSFSTITYNRINPQIRPIDPPTFQESITVGNKKIIENWKSKIWIDCPPTLYSCIRMGMFVISPSFRDDFFTRFSLGNDPHPSQ